MINTTYPVHSQNMPGQNVPVQTSYNHFPTFQQPQTAPQQMQTGPTVICPSSSQDPYKPCCKAHQAEMFATSHYQTNTSVPPWSPVYHPGTVPGMQTQPSQGPLPQNVLDQIRCCVGNTAPIFILPSCHQPTSHQQSQTSQFQHPVQSTVCCTPSFYPYPIPMPVFNSYGAQARGKDEYGCCCPHRSQNQFNGRVHMCGCDLQERGEHQCTVTSDDTICSRKNCPAALSLQALASQLLSMPGIISCAVTRLILRKIPGSNIPFTMEETMDKAMKSIEGLNKNQLLAEARNAQQVIALINLHMTSNPPANVIPLLTLFQLKVNVLKAQVENLINKKVMESQSCYGCEVETSGPIDPTILTMRTNAELRDLLTALRQKECDERVNVNFAPYCSQKVIAEARLNNVQAKIQQVEAEFDRRRDCAVPIPTLTSRVIQQFSESRCTYGFTQAQLFEPYVQSPPESPDPFAQRICNTKRLCLKPGELNEKYISTTNDVGVSPSKDVGTGECSVELSVDECTCVSSSSDDSLDEAKKKLRLNVDRKGLVTLTSVKCCLKDVPLFMLTPNVVTRIEEDLGKIEEMSEHELEEEGLLEPKLEPETEVLVKDDDEDDVEMLPIRKKSGSEEFGVITISDDEEDEQAKLRDEKEPKKEIEIIVISDDEDEEGIDIGKEKIEAQHGKDVLVITISDDEEEGIDQKKVEIKEEPEIDEIILEDEDIELKSEIKDEKEIPDHTVVKKELEEEFATEKVIKKEPIEKKVKLAPPWKVAHAAKTWQLKTKSKLRDEDIKSVDVSEEPRTEREVETLPIKEEPEEAKKPKFVSTAVMQLKPTVKKAELYIPPRVEATQAREESPIFVTTLPIKEEPEEAKKPKFVSTAVMQLKPTVKKAELYIPPRVEATQAREESPIFVTTLPIKEEPEEAKKPKFVSTAVMQLKPTVKKAELYIPPRVEATQAREESPIFVTTFPIKEEPEEAKKPKFVSTAVMQLKPTVKKAELYIPPRVEATQAREESPIFVTRAYIKPEVMKTELQAQPEIEIKVEPKVANPKKKTELVITPRFDTATVREGDKESKPEKEPYVRSKGKVAETMKFWEKLKEVHPANKSVKPKIAPEITVTRKESQAAIKDIEEPKTEEPQPYTISKKELVKAIKALDLKEKVPIDTPKETEIGTVPETIEPQVPVEEIEKPETERYIISKKKLMEAIKTIETNKTEETDPKDRLDLSGVKGLYKQVVATLGDKPMVKDIPVTPQPRVVGPSGITWTPDPLLGSIKPPRNPDDKKKTNPKSDGGSQKKIGENVQIVSMMSHVEYRQQFGDFWGAKINECMQEDERERNFESTNVERAHITDDTQIVSEKVNTSIIFVNQQYGPSMISVATETSMEKISLSQKMFPKSRRSENKEVNGSNPFPPLKESDTMGTETISENVFHQRGIESGWKTVCDRGSSCWDSEIEDSIVSAIYSAIENQIASFTSLLRNVPSIRLNKMPSNGSSLPSQRDSMRNKKIKNAKDDWVFLPSNAYDERSASARNRDSVSKIREMKQSIIVDKETNKYLLVGGSVNSNELGFKRPYQTRRFLVIRSRLKNPANSKHEQPFTIVKRPRRTKAPRTMRRERKKKFSSLPKIPEEMETLSNDSSEFVNVENETLSETSSSEFVKISENEISQLMNEYDMDENNNCASDSFEREQRINNYSGNK